MTHPNSLNDDLDAGHTPDEAVKLPLAKSPELSNLLKRFDEMHRAILGNESLNDTTIQHVGNSLTAANQRTLQEKENRGTIERWKRIENGTYSGSDIEDIRFLNNETTRKLVELGETSWELGHDDLPLRGLSMLTDTQADILSGFKGAHISLDSLTSLSDHQAAALSRFEGRSLSLSGLQTINDTQMKILCNFKGEDLVLNGLSKLTDSQAISLSEFEGNARRIFLMGVKSLTERQAKQLTEFQGKIHIGGVRKLSSKAAKALYPFLRKFNVSDVVYRYIKQVGASNSES